ncbi:MGMT family protein [Methylophaga thalassica]|uniref:MGMT family protein n=1 Tax=Methylophaga thalassica TaxID=40223 RepID=UPI002E7C4037|nr:MGMT family protein [Methylophaga thalassica]WVI84862.1 MGMT family protein [Methylophaga thalassica]
MNELDTMIWQTVADIPLGKVMTYGQIAKHCGYPGYARYVGTVLKHLPPDTELPWHRVVNAQGRSSFPEDSDKYAMQIQCLRAEGIVIQNGKIQLSVYQHH